MMLVVLLFDDENDRKEDVDVDVDVDLDVVGHASRE
jgi:hypothetical protein